MRAFIYTMDIEESLSELGSNAITGLSSDEVKKRAIKHGPNALTQAKRKSAVRRFFSQSRDPHVLILLAAAAVSSVFASRLMYAIVILVILITGKVIAAVLRGRASKTLDALKEATKRRAKVRREGVTASVDACDLVVGDIVMLGQGDIVPADVRLIESVNLQVDESSVTGETVFAKKDASAVLKGDAALDERHNIAFMGSIVTEGRGAGVVYATGMNTEAGKNAIISPRSDEEMRTSLQDALTTMIKSLGVLCAIVSLLVAVIGILYDVLGIGAERGITEILLVSGALLVATVPKPIAVAAVSLLASGVNRLIKAGNIVKSFRAFESIGSATVVCINKTGVLTQGRMTVTKVADTENVYDVTGVGYKAKGHVVADTMITRNIALMAEIAVLCNDATYDMKKAQITGDETEGALLVFGAKLGHDKETLNSIRTRIQEIPFGPVRKMSSTYNRDGDRVIMYSKGAPEVIIHNCSYVYLDGEILFMSDTIRAKLMAQNETFAAQGFRVLACAYKVYNNESEIDNTEDDLIYVGMMCLADPLLEDVRESVARCRMLGIGVKIITGEHKHTASVIALALGIIKGANEVLDADELNALTDEKLEERVKTVNVFTRISPEQKLWVITALKAEDNNVIAVTGDRLDDVPSLKKADIGIAAGEKGTDIAKETASMILSENYLASIAGAIERGRSLYSGIRNMVGYLLSCTLALIMLFFIAVVCTLPMPLSAAGLLLISLLTGILPALAIGMEKNAASAVRRKLVKPEDSVVNRKTMGIGITRAIVVFAVSFSAFLYGLFITAPQEGIMQQTLAVSMCFFTFTVTGLLLTYPAKTEGFMFSSGTILNNKYLNISVLLLLALLTAIMSIPGLGSLFSITALTVDQILICLLLVFIAIASAELSKFRSRR